MKLIKLTQGQWAVVDDKDYEWLSQWKWCALRTSGGRFYAVRNIYGSGVASGNRSKMIRMHRLIVGAADDQHVDHKNNDGLLNTRDNLRVCSIQENSQNRGPQRDNKSGFKGVIFYPNYPTPFKVSIMVSGVLHHIGYFKTAILAALAYDEAARRLHGEFAFLNFPETLDIQAVAA